MTKVLKGIIIWLITWESRLILAKYKPFIVAVTGSVGKTSTKDAIYSALKDQSRYVRKSEKSLNSDIGLPLTIIGVPTAWKSISGWMSNMMEGLRIIFTKNDYPDTLILEVGADHPGDIRSVAHWLKPHITVITQVSSTPVHVEFFSSPEEVFEEKASLAEHVRKNGAVILFADNEKVMTIAERVANRNATIVSFGTVEQAMVKGSDAHIVYGPADAADKHPVGMDFTLSLAGSTQQISVRGVLGASYMYPLLAAAAVGYARKVPMDALIKGLHNYDHPKGRMNIVEGANDTTIIDDTYNSSPDAVVSALETLRTLECRGEKFAVLGDMLELGQYSTEQHRAMGKVATGAAGHIITVGQRARAIGAEALSMGFAPEKVKSFDDSVEAAGYLQTAVKPGDIILIKGSQSIRMERIVKTLMKDPSRAESLLVRQEPEWLEKK